MRERKESTIMRSSRSTLGIRRHWNRSPSQSISRGVRVVGLELAAVPGLPEVALGIERTSFAKGCCGNTIWYRNWSLRGGWAAGGRPLGHPLAGHGVEWLVHGRADLFSARARIGFQLF